jgi:subtilisin family serine protease
VNRKLSTALLSAAFALYVGLAAGCGGGGGYSAAVAAQDSAAVQKPSRAASNNGNGNRNGNGKKDSQPSWADQLSIAGESFNANKSGVYIVMMKDDPAVMVEAGNRTAKYNPNSAAARRHAQQLESKHNQALAKAGGNKLYSYVHSFNGFAAEMTGNQAVAMAKNPEVLRVWPDELRQLNTNYSPEFLGLDAANGPWDTGYVGEGVVVGVIDTGIWPENDSFLADDYGPPPPQWRGPCQGGEQWSQQNCNNKVIGARYFPYGFGASRQGRSRDGVLPQGYNSVRDDASSGHGSHTAATAAGNRGVTMTLAGENVLGDSDGSGVAPRARIASYKVCWNDAGCALSDLVAAIDTAVADGVDVINYSIGSDTSFIFGPDDVSFLFAAAAGVYVATSNGNAGPGPGTVGSPASAPWLLSVGASTRDGVQTTLGFTVNDTDAAGEYSALEGAITLPLSVSGDVTADLVAADPLQACEPLANDLSGKIAFIERGTCAFTTKVENAVDAGATAVLLFTDDRPKTVMGGDITGKTRSVPGEMIDRDVGLAILAELESGPVNGTMSPTSFLPVTDIGNVMADFSSRGPTPGAIDIIKPDVTAPGVDIFAAITPTPLPEGTKLNTGQIFGYRSGTSMSSPHAAGALALIKQAYPDWSPAAAKSALMTTARQDVLKEDGSTPADPFDMGSGHIQPGNALDPGLVYDAGLFDYAAYICAVNPDFWVPGTCEFLAGEGLDVEDPTQLNYPSIGVSSMVGTKTVTRTVTNVGDSEATYTVSTEDPPGISINVSPSELTLAPGSSASFDVTLTVTPEVATGAFLFGSITWSDGEHEVYSPVAARPLGISAPAELAGTGTEGQLTFDVGFGFEGDYTAGVHGLNPATEIPGNVVDDPNNEYDFPGGPGITRVFWVYEDGTAYSRWQLRDEFTDGDDDLDLYVWECDSSTFLCTQVGLSGTPTSNEQVDILLPKGGAPDLSSGFFYVIDVHGWQTDGPDANYTLFQWEFGLVDDAGNMTVDPSSVSTTLGGSQTLTVDWSGLTEGAKYLGAISHSSPGGLEGLTLIGVE